MDADRIGRIRKLKVEFDELRAIAERERERERALNEYYTGIGRLPEGVDDMGAETGLPSLESMRSFDPSSSTSRGPATGGGVARSGERHRVLLGVAVHARGAASP